MLQFRESAVVGCEISRVPSVFRMKNPNHGSYLCVVFLFFPPRKLTSFYYFCSVLQLILKNRLCAFIYLLEIMLAARQAIVRGAALRSSRPIVFSQGNAFVPNSCVGEKFILYVGNSFSG